MILAVDIGNSDVVMGFFKGEEPDAVFRTATQPGLPALEYEKRIRAFFLEQQIHFSEVKGVVLSSVVPALTPVFTELLGDLFLHQPLVAGPLTYKGLKLAIKNPYEIGTDLVANAIAAFHYYQSAVIVVDFGTALTFTIVGGEGEVLGVNIAPGIKTAMKSLFHQTAQLPIIPLEYPSNYIGTDTVQAIQTGILVGYVGLVKEVIARIREQEELRSFKVVATGGLSLVLKPLSSEFDAVDPHLTLKGLRLMHEFNHSS